MVLTKNSKALSSAAAPLPPAWVFEPKYFHRSFSQHQPQAGFIVIRQPVSADISEAHNLTIVAETGTLGMNVRFRKSIIREGYTKEF